MALNPLDRHATTETLALWLQKRRPPPAIRDELDIGWRCERQSVTLFEIRPDWKNPREKHERPFAKTTYNQRTGLWKIFWRRQDLKWHGYTPQLHVPSVATFLQVVDQDAMGCFWG